MNLTLDDIDLEKIGEVPTDPIVVHPKDVLNTKLEELIGHRFI